MTRNFPALRFRFGVSAEQWRRSLFVPSRRASGAVRTLRRGALLLAAAYGVCCGLADDERDEKNKYEYLTFSDAAFEKYCLGAFDLNGDGRISRYEAQRVLRLDCSGLGIGSLYEIREFTRLQRLDCSHNSIAELNVTKLPQLEWLDCSHNRLTTLDVGGLRGLTTLYCSDNRLASLDLGSNASLAVFEGRRNTFPVLDLRGCDASLRADVTDNERLKTVYCLAAQSVAADAMTDIIRQ